MMGLIVFYYVDVAASNALILLKESGAKKSLNWNLKDYKLDWVTTNVGVNIDTRTNVIRCACEHQHKCYLEANKTRKRCGWCKMNIPGEHDHQSHFLCRMWNSVWTHASLFKFRKKLLEMCTSN